MILIRILVLSLCLGVFENYNLNAQSCGAIQTLTSTQEAQINILAPYLDSALKNENLVTIDSLTNELKAIFGAQGGIPDDIEVYYTLVTNINWLNISDAILLSRELISVDSMLYVQLWKTGKGLMPPLYQPHSLFLRSSAEMAVGLLQIADKETDITRKNLYTTWATQTLDSLATMQLPSGAFPFPDLRTYSDPVFTPIIQNFLNECGSDSVLVLVDGWIIDDKNTGEFKFDAGVIGNAYYKAYLYTGNINYKTIALSVANYLKPLAFSLNYNYNTFVSMALTRGYQLTGDTSYLNRAFKNLRYGVYPGQLPNGRWVDGHNANSRYHALMIYNMAPTIEYLDASYIHKPELESMMYKAVKNMVEYSYNCNSATGYKWLLSAYQLSDSIIPSSLHDSIADLIGRHINQSAINGKYLDVPTMGQYLELLGWVNGVIPIMFPIGLKVKLYPNPTTSESIVAFALNEPDDIELALFDLSGQLIQNLDKGLKGQGTYSYKINLNNLSTGRYLLRLKTNNRTYVQKLIKTK